MNLNKLSKSVRERGVSATLKRVASAALDLVRWQLDSQFDKVHRVETSGRIAIADLHIANPNAAQATWYEPVPNSCFRQLLEHLPVNCSDYVFIDYGSGKGRVLFLASDHPFNRVIGIEFSPQLHEIARRNISTYRSRDQRCHRLESVCLDAADFELPPEPSVLFFYSPFKAPLMSQILDNVKASLKSHPRELYLLYIGVLPEIIALLEHSGLACREVKLRRDYLRGTTKRGFILHSGVTGAK